jgi:hypothetical protein
VILRLLLNIGSTSCSSSSSDVGGVIGNIIIIIIILIRGSIFFAFSNLFRKTAAAAAAAAASAVDDHQPSRLTGICTMDEKSFHITRASPPSTSLTSLFLNGSNPNILIVVPRR